MHPVVQPPIAAPPDDPVGVAIAAPALRIQLEKHARAFFQRHLTTRPRAIQLEASDHAAQEALARAWEKRSKFDAAKGSVEAWVHGILQHVCREKCLDLHRRHEQLADDAPAWLALEARLDPDRDTSELSNLLNRLEQEERGILTWAYLDELSHIEIAEKLGISPGASRVRLNRALTQLKRIANDREGVR